MKVLILGYHPTAGQSMMRYSQLLVDAYSELGHDVKILTPTGLISRTIPILFVRKYFVYVEKLLIFPLSLITKLGQFEITHIADHSDGIWANYPWIKPTYITCHDLIAIKSAYGDIGEHKTKLFGHIYQSLIRRGLGLGKEILCVSKTTLIDVQKYFPASKSSYFPNPVDPAFYANSKYIDLKGNDKRHFLIIGNSNWRKRRIDAIDVWCKLNTNANSQDAVIPLVVIGPNLNKAERDKIDAELISYVRIMKSVTEDELALYYRQAFALIQMSIYEGFCWPVVESNSLGTVCICNDISILREVGPHNVFINLHNKSLIWHEILSALRSEERIADCKISSSAYSWETFKENISTNLVSED